MSLRRIADVILGRPASPPDERSTKTDQTEALASELGTVLDRVDRLAPPKHARFASYRRVRIER